MRRCGAALATRRFKAPHLYGRARCKGFRMRWTGAFNTGPSYTVARPTRYARPPRRATAQPLHKHDPAVGRTCRHVSQCLQFRVSHGHRLHTYLGMLVLFCDQEMVFPVNVPTRPPHQAACPWWAGDLSAEFLWLGRPLPLFYWTVDSLKTYRPNSPVLPILGTLSPSTLLSFTALFLFSLGELAPQSLLHPCATSLKL